MVNLLKKRMTGVLLGLLSIALIAGFTPQFNAPAYAADNDPAIAPGAAVLSTGVNTENAQIIYYGNHDWYVIAYDGKDEDGIPYTYVKTDGNTANLYPEGTVTLLSKDVIGEVQFDNTWSGNAYGDANCLLKKRIDGEGGIVNDFSAGEQYAVYQRTLEGGGQNYGLGQPSSNLISGDSVTGALLWPLSAAEADVVVRELSSVAYDGFLEPWWLRSPGNGDYMAAFVDGDGTVYKEGQQTNSGWTAVRPAFFLDLGSVLLTSAGIGGKISGDEGPDALQAQGGIANDRNEWKVTVKDTAHASFTIDSNNVVFAEDGSSVTVPYSGAAVGDDEYISAVITDKPVTEKDAKIEYYGRIIKASSDEDASVTINLAGKMGENDKLYVFNEQINGDKETDYASAFNEVAKKGTAQDLNLGAETCDLSKGPVNIANYPGIPMTLEALSKFGYIQGSGATSDSEGFIHMPADLDKDGSADIEVIVKNKITNGVIAAYGDVSGKAPITFKFTAKELAELSQDSEGEPYYSSITFIFSASTTPISKATIKGITAKTYTGKALKPAPKVVLKGKTLKAGKDYTASYKKNVNVGTATVVIKGKGSYTGTKTKTFKINPKGASLKSVTKASKAVKVKWTKQAAKMKTSRITGYQILLATNSKFTKGKKTVNVTGYSKVSKKVTGLKGGKKYYVKIRTYKKIGSTKYYSKWSGAKSVKTAK